MNSMQSLSNVKLGVVPTHLKFVGGLVPDEQGKFPRGTQSKFLVVENLHSIRQASAMPFELVQIPFFSHAAPEEVDQLVAGLREMGLKVYFILMVGGADPMNPEDSDRVVEILAKGLKAADRLGIDSVASTSIEEWMKPGATPKEGEEFEAAIAQNVKVHLRALQEAEVSHIKSWHIEFLRWGEFQTFTNLARCWRFVSAANQMLGDNFFKVLVDAAHCGDSGLSFAENEDLIQRIAKAGELGMFHASAKTTRGCLLSDDGWVPTLLTACAQTGSLQQVFVEIFHHEDPALEGLRQLDARHGIDTRLGRTYDQLVIDGLENVGKKLNHLVLRGILPGKK
jgi:sugar phosphate isomerase/epimerase